MPISSHVQIDLQPIKSLPAFCLENVDKFKDKLYAVDPDGRTLTFGEVRHAINQVSVALAAAGIKQGDAVLIIAPNHINWPAAYFGIMQLGAVACLCNPAYSKTEIAHQLRDSASKVAFAGPDQVAVLKEAIGISPGVALLVSIDQAPAGHPDVLSFEAFSSNDGAGVPEVRIDGEDVAALPYSSGTTGLSKGVMLTHNNIANNIRQTMHPEFLHLAAEDVVLAVLPFYHIYGQVVIMNACLRGGQTMVLMAKFEPLRFLSLIQERRVSFLPLAPPIVLFLAKHPKVSEYDLGSVRLIVSGAAPLSAELGAECAGRLGGGVVVMHGYGMTELSPVSHVSPRGSRDNGFVPVCNTLAMIVDENGGECAPGQRGELWVKGPQVMKGYLNNPAATASTVDGAGWLHTGDIAVVGEGNKFYVVDRLKELIKVKAFQVPPAELEALLLTHPAIADCAVIPIPDDRCGEVPRAYVVLKAGVSCSEEEVKEFVKGQVADHKQLRGGVAFVAAVPKSPSGKILRRVLRDQFAAEQAQPCWFKTAAVTGGNGFLGTHVVQQLLAKGVHVVTTVRDPTPEKVLHLQFLPGAERLRILDADLVASPEAAFARAFQGCEVLFHTASPFFYNVKADGVKELVEPAVEGTKKVLGAAIAAGVKHCCLTASVASVCPGVAPRNPAVGYDACDFADLDKLKGWEAYYPWSKTAAEQVAWELARGRGLPMCTIHPCMIYGPLLQPGVNTSSQKLLDLLQGHPAKVPNTYTNYVDVRDVAAYHIAATNAKSEDRHMAVAGALHHREICALLRGYAGAKGVNVPTELDEDGKDPQPILFNIEPAKRLGVSFRPASDTFQETVKDLLSRV